MPRAARLDILDLLHHVIVRGIERRDIFADDEDRYSFVQRLSTLLVETGTACFAWALMPNHFHLLLRPSRCKLATFMRRLLTGYAVSFNLRHHRSGHLFQNRYKSLVCDEDEYFLQLIRYIHLNPMRGRLVEDLQQLEQYHWSGHRVVIGKQDMPGQDVEHVLALFGQKLPVARRQYRQFITDGLSEGARDDLVGKARPECRDHADARILGASDFAEEIRLLEPALTRCCERSSIPEIIAIISHEFGVPARGISGRSRSEVVVRARAAVCKAALDEGHSAAEIARFLGMSRHGVGVAAKRDSGLLR